MDNLTKIKMTPPADRKRIKLGRRGSYTKRPKYDHEKLIEFLMKEKIHSAGDLRRLGKHDDNAPTVYTVLKALGPRWRDAQEYVWGVPPPVMSAKQKPSHESLLALALTYRISDRQGWDKFKASSPSTTIPSRHYIRLHFGSCRNFFAILEETAHGHALSKYTALWSHGKAPTEAQARAAGINMTALTRETGGLKRPLDWVLKTRAGLK